MGHTAARMTRSRHARTLWAALVVMALLALLAGCTENDVERSLGKVVSKQVERSFRVEDDPLVTNWVQEVGTREAEASRRGPDKVPPSFKVLDSDIVNAMAVPWGHVYVTTGLLETADSDDEVATVIGHEWGHIEQRHTIKALKKHIIWSTIAQVALADQSRTVQNVGILGLNLGMLKNSRKDELQADRKGVELSYKCGYDPNGEAAFFEKLVEKRKRKPSHLEVYFMTHPALETRIKRMGKQPELDENNAEALTTIGRGYLARYRVAEAIAKLQAAVELDGSSFDTHKSLGDAYRLSGNVAKAREQYRAALQIKGDNEVEQRLASLHEPAPVSISQLSDEDRGKAQQALADAADALEICAATRVTVEQRIEGSKGDLKEAQTAAVDALHGIDALYGTASAGNGAIDELVVAADAAVQQANEAVYGVENLHDQMLDAVGRSAKTVEACRERLRRALKEGATDGEVNRLVEAITESKRAMTDVAEAGDDDGAAVEAARNATRVANNTLQMLGQFTYHRPRGVELRMNMDAIDNATERGKEAAGKVKRAKEKAAGARTRALLAQIDVATAGAAPHEERVYDGLVAHYMQSDIETVAGLREKGYGYGDVSLALALAKRLDDESPEYIAEHGRGMSQSLVDYAKQQGGSLRNISIFMTYLANAIGNQQPDGEAQAKEIALSAEGAAD